MTRISEIDSILSLCAEQLAGCAGEIADQKLLEKERGVYKIGKAIAEINEVRTDIYSLHPDLKPENWGSPPSDEMYASWFEEAKRIAEEYREEGQIDKAIRTMESFIFIGPPESIATQARHELQRIRAASDV